MQTATYLAKNRITSYVKDVYLMILTGIFSQTNTEYKWDPDEDITKILISDRIQKPIENQAFRPMIYLHRGRMAYANTSIDKMLAKDMELRKTAYSDLVQGTMILNAVSSEGLEAEELGSMLFTGLQAFSKEFQKLGFQHMVVNEILEERIVDSGYDEKLIEVPIITSFTFQHTWCVSELNLKLLQKVCIQRAREANEEEKANESASPVIDSNCVDDGNGIRCRPFGPGPDKKNTRKLINPCCKSD